MHFPIHLDVFILLQIVEFPSLRPPSSTEFKNMLERGMRVKITGLVKAAQYNGLEATVKQLLPGTDKTADCRVRVSLDGLAHDGKEMSIKLENSFVLSCIFCQETSPPSILSGCGCQGTIADVRDGAVVAHVHCRAKHFLEVTPSVAGTHKETEKKRREQTRRNELQCSLDPQVSEALRSSMAKASRFDMTLIQNMWNKCPKCNQSFTGEMRIGLAESWWSQVCDQEEKDPVGYMGAVMNLTATLGMLKEDPERRKQYQQILSKAGACLIKYGDPEEPEMCGAFMMILNWHIHEDFKSHTVMMHDLSNFEKDVARRDQLELLDFQRLCMGENATPSQLRSLTMSKATDEPELGSYIISAKDFMSVSQIMEGIDEALSGQDFSNGYPDIVGEGLYQDSHSKSLVLC
jgi:hypothetical protein